MVQKQAKICKFLCAHLRQFISGVGKSRAAQRICNCYIAQLSGIVPKLGFRRMENLSDWLRQKAPRRYFTFTLPLAGFEEVQIYLHIKKMFFFLFEQEMVRWKR